MITKPRLGAIYELHWNYRDVDVALKASTVTNEWEARLLSALPRIWISPRLFSYTLFVVTPSHLDESM